MPLPAVAAAAATDDVQKKISLLSNSSAIAGELFPHYVSDTVQPSMPPRSGSGLVVVASLVSKIPNQGGENSLEKIHKRAVVKNLLFVGEFCLVGNLFCSLV